MDPFYVSITAALVGKAVGSLYETVRARFKPDPAATRQLEQVTSGQATTLEQGDFAQLLGSTAQADAQFKASLDAEFARHVDGSAVGDDTVSNVVGGNVSDQAKILQGRDIEGGVHF